MHVHTYYIYCMSVAGTCFLAWFGLPLPCYSQQLSSIYIIANLPPTKCLPGCVESSSRNCPGNLPPQKYCPCDFGGNYILIYNSGIRTRNFVYLARWRSQLMSALFGRHQMTTPSNKLDKISCLYSAIEF